MINDEDAVDEAQMFVSTTLALPVDMLEHSFYAPDGLVTVWRSVYQATGQVMDSLMHGPITCNLCGEFLRYEIEAERVVIKEPCAAADGIVVTTTIEVPSGKLLVSDDLRPVYEVDERENFVTYNSVRGQAQVVKAMGEIGCGYGPVGNTSPHLYRTASGELVVAVAGYDEETNKEDVGFEDAEELAQIVTDLWAYSMADYEDWKSRGGDPSSLNWTHTVVDVEPGSYEFTWLAGSKGFDDDTVEPVVYARIRRLP